MEVLLQEKLHKPEDMGYSKSSSSLENSDMFMMRPCLDYINEILMEEADDDVPCVHNASYQAVFSDFYGMLGEHLWPNSYVHSASSDGAFDLHPPPQHPIYRSCAKGLHAGKQHVKVVDPRDRFYNVSNMPHNLGVSEISRPGNGHSFQQEMVEIGFPVEHDSGSQGQQVKVGSHMPLKTEEAELYAMKNCSSNGVIEASVSFLSDHATAAQNRHNAIHLKDEVHMDVGSCWGKDAVVKGSNGCRSIGGQEQGNDNINVPPVDEDFSSKFAEIAVSFEDLKLKDVYTDLYVGEPPSSASPPPGAARDSKHSGDKHCKQSGDKKRSLAGKGSKTGKKSTLEVHALVDVRDVLLSCAQAVAIGDARKASKILQDLYQVHGASPNGTYLQRIAHFFSMALAARLRGIGEHHFRAMSHKMPSVVNLIRATKVGFERVPYGRIFHYYANQSILKAAEGASRLHIVDYGLLYGIQWPCLISALAERKGGPPLLVITGIESPQPGVDPAKRLEESGRRLAAYAKTHNVPFQYHAVVSYNLEDLAAASLNLHKGEVLVVNCTKCLRHLDDESVDLALSSSPRQNLLTFMRSLNPHLLLTVVSNAAYNSPFFVYRFREALDHFSNLFDMLGAIWSDSPQRLVLERSCFYRDILNVVGCEGTERVERPETYKQWHARITKAGFEQVPIPPTVLSRSRSHLEQRYHKDFFLHDEANGWMLMGWKGWIRYAISAWKPCEKTVPF